MIKFNPVSTNHVVQNSTSTASFQGKKVSPQEHLLTVIRDNDPSGLMADALKKKLQEDTQVINQLSAKKSSQITKEEARQRIERIKEQIKLLRLMAAVSANPQATLRQIKQLSRELAEAARGYGMSAGVASHDMTEPVSSEETSSENASPAEVVLMEEKGDSFPQAGNEESAAQSSNSSSPQAWYNYYTNDNKNLLKNIVEVNGKKVALTEAQIRENMTMADDIRRLAAQLKNLYYQAVNQARQKKQHLHNMDVSIQQNLSVAEKSALSIVTKTSFPPAIINTFA